MGDLTANISRSETTCKCGCGFDVADYELIKAVQSAADFFRHRDGADRVAILITSGNRCPRHNHMEGGADNSQHCYGKAMDFKLKTFVYGEWRLISANETAALLDGMYPEKFGIGIYPRGRVHLDVRPTRARWVG